MRRRWTAWCCGPRAERRQTAPPGSAPPPNTKVNRSIKTISSQKKSAMMKLGVENDIALLNYLSSVSMTPLDKD
jgi:hypothetical protein